MSAVKYTFAVPETGTGEAGLSAESGLPLEASGLALESDVQPPIARIKAHTARKFAKFFIEDLRSRKIDDIMLFILYQIDNSVSIVS
jgi:hypothetical protein